MSIVILFALIGGMSEDMEQNLRNFYSGDVRIRNSDYEKYERFNPVHLTVDIAAAEKILADITGIDSWVPRTTFPTNIYINGTNFGAVGVGVDLEKEADYLDLDGIIAEGRLPSPGENEMIIGAVLARNLNLSIGDKLTIMSMTAARGTNAITLKITGFAVFPVAALNAQYFWMPIDRAEHFLQMPGACQEILIKTADGIPRKTAAADINAAFAAAGIDSDVRGMEQVIHYSVFSNLPKQSITL